MAMTFALPAGAAEPRERENWTYDRETGRVEDADGRPVLYVAAHRMDAADVSGGKGRATRTGLVAAAAPDMLLALKEISRNAALSDAWLDPVRAAIAKAEGRS